MWSKSLAFSSKYLLLVSTCFVRLSSLKKWFVQMTTCITYRPGGFADGKNRPSRKIDFQREYDFQKSFSLTENQFSRKTRFLYNCLLQMTLVELSAILEANHGPNIYDRMFSHRDAESHTENDFEVIISRLSGEIAANSAQVRITNRVPCSSLKHESRILGHSNHVCAFSIMELVRLCAVWPTENWLGSSLNQTRGRTTVRESYSRALEQGSLITNKCRINPYVWQFSGCCTADFGRIRSANQLYNNQKSA